MDSYSFDNVTMGMYDTLTWIGHEWQTKDLQDQPLLQNFRITDSGMLQRMEGYLVPDDVPPHLTALSLNDPLGAPAWRFQEVGWLHADFVHGPVRIYRLDTSIMRLDGTRRLIEYELFFHHGLLETATLLTVDVN